MPKKAIKKSAEFKVTFKIPESGEAFEYGGDTIAEGLGKLELEKIPNGKCFVIVEGGGRSTQMLLYPQKLKALKVNKLFKEILGKRLQILLK